MSQFIGLVHNLVLNKMEKGELNIDSIEALKSVLKENEIHTRIIEDQLDMCKKDHEDLRAEMNHLMDENRELYDRLKSTSESALFKREHPDMEPQEVVENLQHQLSLALEEKDTVEAMWKSSAQEVDALKAKLEELQSGKQLALTQSKLNDVQKDYTEAIKILEDKISKLKSENDQLTGKCQILEDQLKKVNSHMDMVNEKTRTLNNSLRDSTEQEQQWKSKYLALEAKFIELDRAYQADKVKYAQIAEYEKAEAGWKARLDEAVRSRHEIQVALERCQERMQDHLKRTASDRTKIEEAVALVEGASRDREEALARERAATDEVKKLKAELKQLMDEAGRRVVEEETNSRRKFDKELAAVRDKLQIVEQERDRKKVEVEQLQKECARLQSMASQAQLPSRADKEAERMTKQLSLVEMNCEQLQLENDALKDTISQLEERCRRNTAQRLKLKTDLQRLVQNAKFYQEELAISEQKADLLSSQLQATSLDLAKLHSNTILQRGNQPGVEPQVSLSSSLALYKKLSDSYGQMNDKWKNEMNALTDKFEEKLKKSKKSKDNQVNFAKGKSNGKK